jgi:hypothetical protein
MADEGGEPRRPEKVSKSELANEIVELLRQAAHKIIELGDSLEREIQDHAQTRIQYNMLTEEWALASNHEEVFEEWQELLLNFRSGIVDEGELFAGTVGAR